MIDWLASMQQSFEYYTVDPITWKDVKRVDCIKSSSINRDSSVETLGSASIDITEFIDECYIRVYLVATQNGVTERVPLGTFLAQTPSSSFDGKLKSVTIDAYTPLMELKENPPPLGYSLLKNENIMSNAYKIVRDNVRAPVIESVDGATLHNDFVADTNDTWISYTSDLIANAKKTFALDELGRIMFAPKQEIASMQPVWTYNDDDKSILYQDVSISHDIYGIPNVVEVIYTNGKTFYYSKVVNDDPNSPVSTVSRGREIRYRDSNPSISGIPTKLMIEEYARTLLKTLSTVEYTVSYTHGYCPVRLGDCVRLNYTRAGLNNVKAKVISQTIDCSAGCKVSEKAVFTKKLWR